MNNDAGMINDHCQNLKCVADRLDRLATAFAILQQDDLAKTLDKLARRIDDSRDAITTISERMASEAHEAETQLAISDWAVAEKIPALVADVISRHKGAGYTILMNAAMFDSCGAADPHVVSEEIKVQTGNLTTAMIDDLGAAATQAARDDWPKIPGTNIPAPRSDAIPDEVCDAIAGLAKDSAERIVNSLVKKAEEDK